LPVPRAVAHNPPVELDGKGASAMTTEVRE
jgi:hypothetical protein